MLQLLIIKGRRRLKGAGTGLLPSTQLLTPLLMKCSLNVCPGIKMMLNVKEEKEDSCRQNIQQSKWCMRDQIRADKEVQDD